MSNRIYIHGGTVLGKSMSRKEDYCQMFTLIIDRMIQDTDVILLELLLARRSDRGILLAL